MIVLYGYPPSGNCWKVAQLLEFTQRPYRWVLIDSNAGETRTAEFLARFPIGKVPGNGGAGRDRRRSRKARILCMLTATYGADLGIALPALARLHETFGDRAAIVAQIG